MIFSENRRPLFRIMLVGPDIAHRWPTQDIMPPTESGRNSIAKQAAKKAGLRYESATFPRSTT
jgi:hypothetical protein